MGVYKCPVCEGRGQVPAGFYHTYQSTTAVNTSPETCKSCNGRGVIFDTDCFYPHTNTNLPDDYTFGYSTICVGNSCSNCEHNDRMCYTSNPPKWKCTLNGNYHTADYRCEHWAEQQQKYIQGTEVTDLSDYISLTRLNTTGTEDNTIEGLTKSNALD